MATHIYTFLAADIDTRINIRGLMALARDHDSVQEVSLSMSESLWYVQVVFKPGTGPRDVFFEHLEAHCQGHRVAGDEPGRPEGPVGVVNSPLGVPPGMVNPIRRHLDPTTVGRPVFLVDELPEEPAQPVYDRDPEPSAGTRIRFPNPDVGAQSILEEEDRRVLVALDETAQKVVSPCPWPEWLKVGCWVRAPSQEELGKACVVKIEKSHITLRFSKWLRSGEDQRLDETRFALIPRYDFDRDEFFEEAWELTEPLEKPELPRSVWERLLDD
jgi:hypothetical protein